MAIARRGSFVYRPAVLTPRRSCQFLGLSLLVTGYLGAAPARAHFVLQSPAAAHEQGPLGDPQKAPPCGDNGSAVATGALTAYQAGDVVTITIDETIFHPGHYRIALAMNDISELPAEPIVTPNNTDCGTVPIMSPPVFPVLADGVFPHDAPFDQPQSIDITLPDVSCDNCTLQVIQFMSNHGLNNPGGCFYHHCANISVQGSAATTGAEGTGGEGTAGTSATTVTTTAASQGETAGNESSGGTGVGATGTATATGDEPTSGGVATGTATGTASAGSSGTASDGNSEGGGGCGCSGARGGHETAALAGLLGVLGLGTRRRARVRG